MRLRKSTLFASLCVLFCFQSNVGAQNFPIKISVLDESISAPNFWFTGYEYNPAVIAGTEYILSERKNSDWHTTANLGFFYHKQWVSSVFINSEIAYRYSPGRFSLSPKFGLGYAHVFALNPVYNIEDGAIKKINDYGTPRLMPSLSLELAFKLSKKEYAPSLFITFSESIEIPFNIFTGLHQFVGLGYKFYITKNEKNAE